MGDSSAIRNIPYLPHAGRTKQCVAVRCCARERRGMRSLCSANGSGPKDAVQTAVGQMECPTVDLASKISRDLYLLRSLGSVHRSDGEVARELSLFSR